jgi:hypothetical protein
MVERRVVRRRTVRRVSATRTELLARRARIELARQGRDLLAKKRSGLLRELSHRYITEGQIVLSRELDRHGVRPRIDVLPSLSRLMTQESAPDRGAEAGRPGTGQAMAACRGPRSDR